MGFNERRLRLCDDQKLQLQRFAWHQFLGQLRVQQQLFGVVLSLVRAPPASCRLQIRHDQRITLINEQIRQLQTEAEQLQREIHRLRTGDRAASYEAEAPQSSRLRRLLRAELNLSTTEVVPLFDVLHVPNEAWQNAVEGILGRARYRIEYQS